MKYRNDYRKNVVYCGFTKEENEHINLGYPPGPDDTYFDWDYFQPYRKAPIKVDIDTLKDALKHRGAILIIKVKDDFDPLEFDKKYRKRLNYWYIYYYNPNYKTNFQFSKYSNLYQMDSHWLFAEWYDGIVSEIDDYFKKHPKIKIQAAKKEKLDLIHQYIKKNKELTSEEIANKFSISIRTVQRYMNDINLLYNDIGYDYRKKLWYNCLY